MSDIVTYRTPSHLREHERGMMAVQQNITYQRELVAGDVVEVRSRVIEVRDKVIRFVHEMHNGEDGEVAARCELTGVHVDRRARKSCSLPAEIRSAATAMLPTGPAEVLSRAAG